MNINFVKSEIPDEGTLVVATTESDAGCTSVSTSVAISFAETPSTTPLRGLTATLLVSDPVADGSTVPVSVRTIVSLGPRSRPRWPASPRPPTCPA